MIGGGSSQNLVRNAEPDHHRASHWLVSANSVVFLKAVARLAYIRSGLPWDGPQTAAVATFLTAKGFPVVVNSLLREGYESPDPAEGVGEIIPLQTPDYETVRRLARPDQRRFRAELIDVYGARCAISGCEVDAVLDACHILSHEFGGPAEASNGLVLRQDLHRLFDLGLIAVDPKELSWRFHPDLIDHYGHLLDGRDGPDFEVNDARRDRLSAHWQASQL